MSLFDIKDKMDALVKELNQHSYNYYVLAMPTIADYEFDKKLDELGKLEQAHPEFADPNSPTLESRRRHHQKIYYCKAQMADAVFGQYLQ